MGCDVQIDHAAHVDRQTPRRAVNPQAGAAQRNRDGGKRAAVIALQRKAGNRAVARLLAGPSPIEQRRRSGGVAVQRDDPAGSGSGYRPPNFFPGQFRLQLDPAIEAQLGLLRTPLPPVSDPQNIDPNELKDLLARIRSPLGPDALCEVLRSLPAPLRPAVLPAATAPAPATSGPPAPVPATGQSQAQLAAAGKQLEAAAKQKQKELVSKTTEAAVKMFDAQWGKTSEFTPVFSASVKALVDSVATGGDAGASLGAAATKAGLKILPILYPRVKKPVLDWFNSRSTAEQILVTLPFAAGIGFGSIFGGGAVGKAIRDDTEDGRKIRDTGFELLNGTDLPTGLPWLKATLTVKAHQGEPTDKKYQPAVITGAMITVDMGELTGFRF